jgi:hypothetical protein
LSFGYVEELVVGDVRQIEDGRLLGLPSHSIHRCLREQQGFSFTIRG